MSVVASRLWGGRANDGGNRSCAAAADVNGQDPATVGRYLVIAGVAGRLFCGIQDLPDPGSSHGVPSAYQTPTRVQWESTVHFQPSFFNRPAVLTWCRQAH